MKRSIIAALLATAVAAPAFAQKQLIGEVVQVVPDTSEVAVRVPDTRCEIVEVPVYGNSQSSTGDAIVGAIIGGAIGNQFGSGSGRDAMTVLGAITGADIVNKKGNRIVGYRQEKQCTTAYTTEYQQRTYGYDVTVKVEDTFITFYTESLYKVGQTIGVTKSYSVK